MDRSYSNKLDNAQALTFAIKGYSTVPQRLRNADNVKYNVSCTAGPKYGCKRKVHFHPPVINTPFLGRNLKKKKKEKKDNNNDEMFSGLAEVIKPAY